jgi:hypothetical protein
MDSSMAPAFDVGTIAARLGIIVIMSCIYIEILRISTIGILLAISGQMPFFMTDPASEVTTTVPFTRPSILVPLP